jgi:uncharacterized protein HemX
MANPPDSPSSATGRKPARRPRQPAAGKPARSGRLAAGLALVFATIALLASGYVGYLINSKRGLSDAKGRLFQVEIETARLEAFSGQMAKDLGSVRESQEALNASLQALHNEVGKGRRNWLLAESENLLVIARHRLVYARDARLALEALRGADRQLQQLGDPAYQPVRKALEKEIAALEDYQRLDPSGMAQRLGDLAARVGDLALAPDPRPGAGTAPAADQGFARELWKDLKDLVRVRSTTDIRHPFLLPEQKYYLRENLRLMLYGAQVALLHGDNATFERNLGTALRWLRDHYDVSTRAVQDNITALDGMLKTRPTGLPDTGLALTMLRDIRGKQGGP